MAVPHPAATRESLLRAYACVDWLWDYRTAPGLTDAEHLAGRSGACWLCRFELVPGSSHFVQPQQPRAVTRLFLDWFGPPCTAHRCRYRLMAVSASVLTLPS